MTGGAKACDFVFWVAQQLVPRLVPGHIVVMGNLSIHKGEAVLALIEGADCRLEFLPTYSPDLNPIEMLWSSLKALARRVQARATEALLLAVQVGAETVTPEYAQGWFAHCGYLP